MTGSRCLAVQQHVSPDEQYTQCLGIQLTIHSGCEVGSIQPNVDSRGRNHAGSDQLKAKWKAWVSSNS